MNSSLFSKPALWFGLACAALFTPRVTAQVPEMRDEVLLLWNEDRSSSVWAKFYETTETEVLDPVEPPVELQGDHGLDGQEAQDAITANLNNDGRPDPVFCWVDDSLSLRLSVPDIQGNEDPWSNVTSVVIPGTVANPEDGERPTLIRIVALQLDEDQADELVIAYTGQDLKVHLFPVDFNGTLNNPVFGPEQVSETLYFMRTGSNFDLAAGDFNGNGKDEAVLVAVEEVTIEGGSDNWRLYARRYFGGIDGLIPVGTTDEAAGMHLKDDRSTVWISRLAAIAHDFNGDDEEELAVAYHIGVNSSASTWHLRVADGTNTTAGFTEDLSRPQSLHQTTGNNGWPLSLHIADTDADSEPELIYAGRNVQAIEINADLSIGSSFTMFSPGWDNGDRSRRSFVMGRFSAEQALEGDAGLFDMAILYDYSRSTQGGISREKVFNVRIFRYNPPGVFPRSEEARRYNTQIDSENRPDRMTALLAGDFLGSAERPPSLTLEAPQPVLSVTATLRALVHPGGAATQVWFEWWPAAENPNDQGVVQTTAVTLVESGQEVVSIETVLTGLTPDTEYNYRGMAVNEAFPQDENIQVAEGSFTTLPLDCGWPLSTKTTDAVSGDPVQAIAENGNVWIAGRHDGNVALGDEVLDGNPDGGQLFAALVDPAGRWLWTAGASGSVAPRGLAPDPDGGAWIVGVFETAARFGEHALVSDGRAQGFVARLDQGGNWTWARALSGGANEALAAGFDGAGNGFVAGWFSGTGEAGERNWNTKHAQEPFVASLSLGGEFRWIQGAGGNGRAMGIATDTVGVHVGGEFSGTLLDSLNSTGGSDLFWCSIDPDGNWVAPQSAGGSSDDHFAGIAGDRAGGLLLTGTARGNISIGGGSESSGSQNDDSLIIARIAPDGSLDWFQRVANASPKGIALDRDSSVVFVSADQFENLFLGGTILRLAGADSDAAILRLQAEDGSWLGGRSLGAEGTETAGPIVTGPDGVAVVSGTFQSRVEFGEVELGSRGGEIFWTRMNASGDLDYNDWTIGEPLPVPSAASSEGGSALGMPRIEMVDPAGAAWNDYFYWSPAERLLYPIRPSVLASIDWPLREDTDFVTDPEAPHVTCWGRNVWPKDPVVHVAGAPVELQPDIDGFPLSFQEMMYGEGDGSVTQSGDQGRLTQQFQASETGWSVLRFLKTDGEAPNLNDHPAVFDVARTLPWNDESILEHAGPAVIGRPVEDERHDDAAGGNGYVVPDRSVVDMATEDSAHDRGNRQGPIIPVNIDRPDDDRDDLTVAWYRPSARTGVPWPDLPVRYSPVWPENAETIVIAAGLGTGSLPSADYPGKLVYRQPDPDAPGFNPNEEHGLFIGDTAYAIRADLNAVHGESEPYLLIRYEDPDSGEGRFRVWNVVVETDEHPLRYSALAGQLLHLPAPLSLMSLCEESHGVSGPWFEDYAGRFYARAAGAGGGPAEIMTRYFYPMDASFDFDVRSEEDPPAPGACLPWLDRLPGGEEGEPVNVAYDAEWPEDVPVLRTGDTLFDGKEGLPGLRNFRAAGMIYDDGRKVDGSALDSLVRLFDPLVERTIALGEDFELPTGIATAPDRGRQVFVDVPFPISVRLSYDPLQKTLHFRGYLESRAAGAPLLLINVMTERERDRLLDLSSEPDYQAAILELFRLTRNPNRLDLTGPEEFRDSRPDDALLIGLDGTEFDEETGVKFGRVIHEDLGGQPKALTAGLGLGSGYVTLSENNDPSLPGLPVTLHVIFVEERPFRGEIQIVEPDNVFDERLNLRHSADFAGAPERLEFEWYTRPDEADTDPTLFPDLEAEPPVLNGWRRISTDPGDGVGVNEITIGEGGESGLLTLSDNWFILRFRGYTVDGETPWSDWVAAPGGDRAQLGEGWVKRVLDGINPFEARSDDFHESETATFASMIRQAGARYEGDIAFNPDADNLNEIGLIEAYETMLRRGERLSVDAAQPVNYGPANNALLLAAGRIADLYMLLGNEAFADAADPTIGFPTGSAEYGTEASTIFAFQNQLGSLLEEELVLLRGRDDSGASVSVPPVFNRAFWNFTRDNGEVAYVQAYNITDISGPVGDPDGFIDENDAATAFPQGHGDAWGHYLTAIKSYYRLLRDEHFTWVPRTETISLGGSPVEVDYLDERKFARAAAMRARTGSEIVDLTYRMNYIDDPEGQWQGYQDEDSDRAWGVVDWARRAGTGAFLDWAAAQSVLPAEDPDPSAEGLEKIDRSTVAELEEIVAAFRQIQGQIDKADTGLNPVGLAKGVIPFDIDPNAIDRGETHFEQIHARAVDAMENAVAVFDHANDLSRALRRNQDDVNEFSRNVEMQERDYKNRLLEIFGYPYEGTIGTGIYPTGYDGPDIYYYNYVDSVELTGDSIPAVESFKGYFTPTNFGFDKISHFFPDDVETLLTDEEEVLEVPYPYSAADFGFVPPPSWGSRRAPGEIQLALSTLLQKEAAMKKALKVYDAQVGEIQDHVDLLEARYNLDAEKIRLENIRKGVGTAMSAIIGASKLTQAVAKSSVETTRRLGRIAVEGVPKVVGLSNDATAPLRAGLLLNADILAKPWEIAGAVAVGVEVAAQVAKDTTASITAEKIAVAENDYEIQQQVKALEQLVREEAPLRLELYELREAINEAAGEYQAWIARGLRLIEERAAFRRNAAAETQANRYRDMSFRIFRNDAIQKYRAQFDLAQRYTFLAASAYDFETQTLGGRTARDFLTSIIRQRALGEMVDGRPRTGSGLADILAQLEQNFGVLKGQLGFNNPQVRTERFSLRTELFRIRDDNDDAWKARLQEARVDNLWDLPEFRRYCRIFAAEEDGPQPGLVIRFPTTITTGLNFFGWPLGGGDGSYDPTLFATKVRAAGVWFSDYAVSDLAREPQVYFIPVGQDVLRTPAGNSLATREWKIIDQRLPVPFALTDQDLEDPAWVPLLDSFGDFGAVFGDIRKFSSFSAHHDDGFNAAQTVNNNRLVGRSVWNTDWMLILRGAAMLNDADEGLDRFIENVSDIKIYFQTYSISGN